MLRDGGIGSKTGDGCDIADSSHCKNVPKFNPLNISIYGVRDVVG